MLRRHRVLTTTQLTDLAFTAPGTARLRLASLERMGVIERHRPPQLVGSAPWHYVLGAAGYHALAAIAVVSEPQPERKAMPTVPSRARRHQPFHSTHLKHQLEVNDFFVALVRSTRHGRPGRLRHWLNEWETAAQLGVVRPDGYGIWEEQIASGAVTVVTFILEHDRGTERHQRLANKMRRYRAVASAYESPAPLLLFTFPTIGREHEARRTLAAYTDQPQLSTATATWQPGLSPAERIWLPLPADPQRSRHELAELTVADVAEPVRRLESAGMPPPR